jgi:hypothetical protein
VKRKPLLRNEDGWIINICTDCGKTRLSRQKKLKPLCKSCGIKKSFVSRPAVGLKTLDNMDKIIIEYKSGRSLLSLGKQYGVSAMTIRTKIIDLGCETRRPPEISIRLGTISKAHERIKEMCKTGEFQRNRSAMLQGVTIEEWKGFITPENKRLVASPEYKQWQQSVFGRDNRICQLCSKTKCPIAAHHIYPKAKYPDMVLDVDNGITLCDKCHHKTIGNEDKYINLFTSILFGGLCGKKR